MIQTRHLDTTNQTVALGAKNKHLAGVIYGGALLSQDGHLELLDQLHTASLVKLERSYTSSVAGEMIDFSGRWSRIIIEN